MRSSLFQRRLLMIFAVAIFLPFVLGNASCNVLGGFSDQNSDGALLYRAKRLIDQRDYAGAIEAIEDMTPAGQLEKDPLMTKASAYAARCGLDLLDLATDVAAGVTAGDTLFEILLRYFSSAAASQVTDCQAAETLVRTVPVAQMNSSDYLFLSFLELSKIGVILGASGADANNDGTVEVNPCTAGGTPTITDAYVRQIGTGLNILLSALQNTSNDALDDIATEAGTICTAINAASVLWGTTNPFCSVTDPTAFNANDLTAIRAIINTTDIGTGFCGGDLASSNACRCGLAP